MADYYPLVSRAVAALEPNTTETRHAFYERARAAQLNQLRSRDFTKEDFDGERQMLENVISIVEAVAIATEHSESDSEIVSAYATFCEDTKTRPDCFYDVAVLPHSKQAIAAALERQIVIEPLDMRVEWLRKGPLFLRNFLEGIGSRPLPLTDGTALEELREREKRMRSATPEELREESKRVVANYDRAAPFIPVAEQEAERIASRIDTALRFRKERLASDKDFDRERQRQESIWQRWLAADSTEQREKPLEHPSAFRRLARALRLDRKQ